MKYNPFTLEGKKILITGASSGIGRAVAVECSRMGATLVISGRNEERLAETMQSLEPSPDHIAIQADLVNVCDIESLTDQIPYPLDGIAQCAGLTHSKPFPFITAENLQEVMKVNFEAPFRLTQLLLKNKKIGRGASLVFISSLVGVYTSIVATSAYSASKGALNGFAKGLALEMSTKGIRVNCVNPGMVHTEILSSGVITTEQLDEDAKRYPLKRYGKPEEVAYAVIYLLSDAASWVTGSNLLIDGGYTLL